MMNLVLLLRLLIYALASLVLSNFAGAQEGHTGSVLRTVTALQKPVSYTETKIPLGELVQKVALDTGVPLATAREVTDEPVAVVVKDFPACELLEQLADLLDYHWSRRGKEGAWTYEIWQDLASKQREKAMREATLADAEKRFRDAIARYADMARLSHDQIRSILAALGPWHRSFAKLSPQEKQALESSPVEQDRVKRYLAARDLSSPITRAMAGLLSQLRSQQWTALQEGQPVVFSTDPQLGELPLPVEITRVFRASRPGSPPAALTFHNNLELDQRLGHGERVIQEQWASASGYRVRIIMSANQPAGGVRSLHASAAPIRSNVSAPSPFVASRQAPELTVYSAPMRPQQRGEDTSRERHAALGRNSVLTLRKTFKSEAKPPLAPANAGGRGLPRFLRDLLPDLARIYGVHFISDAYWNSTPIYGPVSVTEPSALFVLLDRWARPKQNWTHQGNLIRLRSHTWFLDRPREVPLHLIRRWMESYRSHGALRLDEFAQIALVLNEDQLKSLETLAMEGILKEDLRDLSNVHRARYVLRLYAALTPAERQSLWEGGSIRVAQMPRLQRQLFLSSLRDINRYQPVPLNLTRWFDGELSLARESLIRAQEKHGMGVGLPIAPSTSPTEGRKVWAAISVDRPSASALRKQETRFPVTQVRFQLHYGAVKPESLAITVVAP